MAGTYLARIIASVNKTAVTSGTTYATVRQGTTASTTPGGTTIAIGQGLAGTSYSCSQLFLTVNTTNIPTGAQGFLILNGTVAGKSSGGDNLEVRECSADTALIPGDNLAALTLLGSAALPVSLVNSKIVIPLSFTGVTRGSSVKLVIHSQRQRTASAPASTDIGVVVNSITAAAGVQPAIDVGGQWALRGVGTVVESVVGSGTLTLTEPSGAITGDLIVAVISMRSTATAAGSISLPAGWTRLGESYTNNVVTSATAVPSGTMAYIVRGSSAPSYAFTYGAGNSVIQGRCVAYNPSGSTPTLDVTGTPRVTATGQTAVSVTGLTTVADDSLIVLGACGGLAAGWTNFNAATDPIGPSGTSDETLMPPVAAWNRRFNTTTTSGADTSVAIADAIKPNAGATGNFTATASQAAAHMILSATFKLVAGAVSVNATGDVVTASAGTVSVTAISGVTVNVTGQQLGITAGTVTVNAKASTNVTGQQLATTAGTVTVSFGQSASVTSTALGITAGTVSVTAIAGVSPGVTSTALAISAGTVTVTASGGVVSGLHIHPDGPYTGSENSDGSTGLTLGFVFCAFAPITITGVRFWKTAIDTATSRTVNIYDVSETVVATGTSSSEPTGTAQWITVPLSTPLAMTGAGLSKSYLAAVYYAQQKYPATGGYYVTGYYSPDSKAYALADAEASGHGFGGNANFNYVVGIAYPNGTFNRGDYWQDIEYSYTTAGGATAIVTSTGLTASDGTVSVVAKQFLSTTVTGSSATTTAGSVTVTTTAAASVNVTGQQLGITAGTVSASIKGAANATGDIVTTSAGTVTVTAKQAPSVNVTGDIVTASAGTVSVAAGGSVSVGVASTALAITAGTVTVNAKASTTVTGGIVTTTAGTVTASLKASPNVTSTALTTTAGTVTVTALSPVSVPVTSTALAITAGSVTVVGKASTTVTGSPVTTTPGSVFVGLGVSVSVTGSQMTATAGTVAAAIPVSVAAMGEVVSAYPGSVTANGVTGAAVTGQALAISRGTVTVAGSAKVNVTGIGVNATAGTVTVTTRTDRVVAVTSPGLGISGGTVSVTAIVKGGVKVWSGTKWVVLPVKAWTGSAWVQKPMKTWTGSAWVTK
jgi:hypothetical protein